MRLTAIYGSLFLVCGGLLLATTYVLVARALVKEPTVLLADEPTGNLDEGTRDEILALLEKLWRERGLTLVVVTHDSVVAHRAQRIGQMTDGKLTIGQTA